MNPLTDLATMFGFIRLMRAIRPDCVLFYTIKPVIDGGLAARLCGVPRIYSLITGLGYAFTDKRAFRPRLANHIAKFLYRWSLRYSIKVFFQNPTDCQSFVEWGLVTNDQARVVNGSGVDLDHFKPQGNLSESADRHASENSAGPCAAQGGYASGGVSRISFLLAARLLVDKGIIEYVEAARIIKRKYPNAEFHLIGDFDSNPTGLKPCEIKKWEDEQLVRFHGFQEDVRNFLGSCHVYVLPSYREGTSRAVLEAMAMGRPIITTDAPGCRETICFCEPASGLSSATRAGTAGLAIGTNGILVPVRNANALAAAMEYFMKDPERIYVMGKESRRYAEERYDVHKVNAYMLKEMGLCGLKQ
jgi:glycosyltransferase involved in cell wall biosynthesis